MSNGLFSTIKVSASGLHGQRTKMDTIAKNLANAETTRTADGTPYRRQRAVFSQTLADRVARSSNSNSHGNMRTNGSRHFSVSPGGGNTIQNGIDVEVNNSPDASEFKVIYDPGHPDADDEGYVLMPNVNVITEMVDMITASRAYEANVAAVQSAKEMFAKALDI